MDQATDSQSIITVQTYRLISVEDLYHFISVFVCLVQNLNYWFVCILGLFSGGAALNRWQAYHRWYVWPNEKNSTKRSHHWMKGTECLEGILIKGTAMWFSIEGRRMWYPLSSVGYSSWMTFYIHFRPILHSDFIVFGLCGSPDWRLCSIPIGDIF